jgi:hypothetical protein
MKRIILILVLSFVAFGCKAQTVVSQTKASGKNIVYTNSGKVEKTGRIIVSNEKNKLQDVKPYFPPAAGDIPDISIVKLDKNKLADILLGAFSVNRLKQLENEKDLSIFFYLSDRGDVLEVSFMADENTKITARELEYIESRIKSDIRATFLKDYLRGSNYISILRRANFSELLKLKLAK